jgi:hypothetical protein
VVITAELLHEQGASPVRLSMRGRPRHRSRRLLVKSCTGDDPHIRGQRDEHGGAVGGRRFEQRGCGLASQEVRQGCGVDDPPNDCVIGIGRGNDVLACSDRRQQRARGLGVGNVTVGPELREHTKGVIEMPFGHRPRAALCHQAAHREMAERRLIPFSEQVEQRRALGKIVVGVGWSAVLLVERAAQAQIFTPRRRRHPRVQ